MPVRAKKKRFPRSVSFSHALSNTHARSEFARLSSVNHFEEDALMLLKHAAMFLVLIACLSTGMTSAFAVEIPQVRNHAPTVAGVNVSDSKQATVQSNDVTAALPAHADAGCCCFC